MTLYVLFLAFALAVCVVGFVEMHREDRARNDLGAHFDSAVAVADSEGDQ